jgi:hypothetical protein
MTNHSHDHHICPAAIAAQMAAAALSNPSDAFAIAIPGDRMRLARFAWDMAQELLDEGERRGLVINHGVPPVAVKEIPDGVR